MTLHRTQSTFLVRCRISIGTWNKTISQHQTLRFCFRVFVLLDRLQLLWLTSPHLSPNEIHTCTSWCDLISDFSIILDRLLSPQLRSSICQTGPLAKWLECSSNARETGVQFQVESYQRLKKWYLIPPCLILSIIRYGWRVKWSNPGKGAASSPTPRWSSYWKGSLWVTLD